MDKNNDIQVNKVNKWDYGVVDMSLWHLKDEFDALVDKLNGVYGIDVFEIEELTGDTYSSMDKVLERFNELEAVHHKECGMISQYEEENRSLREQVNKLINARIELTRDNNNLRLECDRHIDLMDKLRWALEDKGIRVEWSEAALKWCLPEEIGACKFSCRQHYKSEIKQIIELVKSYGLAIYDDRKDAMPDDVVNVGMCGHYYVLGGRDNNELKQHYEDELRIRCKEIDDKNKLIDELNDENRLLLFKTIMDKRYGIMGHVSLLKDKIETLEKENKDLKDTLNKDEEFGKNVGKRIADSIREGCDKGVYKLHPLTRIDIHIEETNSLPIDMSFGRYAIPRISVIFNNTQTEMERDTAEHECEELEKKFKELSKENVDLKATLAMCERDANTAKRDANTAKNLCDNIAFNAKRARNKTPWFNE